MDFQRIELEHKALVEGYTLPWSLRNSGFTFTNFYIWGRGGWIRLAEKNDALFVLARGEKPFMFAPLTPKENYARAMETALDYFRSRGLQPRFKGISDGLADVMRDLGYPIEEDRDNFDYVYAMEDLRDLKGKKFHAKRNHINRFLENNAYEYVELRPSMLSECLELYDRWKEDKDWEDLMGERDSVIAAIENMDVLGLVGGGIRMEGKLVAYTLGEILPWARMGVTHIEKALDIPGLFPLINREFTVHAYGDVDFINREEDMGMEGLRKAKLSYNPVELLKKYRLDL